jgi:hypothetical protein
MNVFEDLIEELRDENLLEQTVVDLRKPGSATDSSSADAFDFALETDGSGSRTRAVSEDSSGGREIEDESEEVSERDFYRKRAVEEISSLQMVEHVLSGIEREHMKTVPASYDDLQAKKALHDFLQVEGDTATSEYADAEFNLMRETEAWSSVLAERDLKMSVANLRRFCENSRPPLSSQALLSLARFYRNASFSELTRAKFEFVMTRLFSREIEGAKRRLLFGRAEMVGHIKTLYANWASVALYSADDISLKSRTMVAGFDEKVGEAEKADTFDQLIQNNFFKKVHEFKSATGEMFFTPEVVAATIHCNTMVGNKFVDLVRLERERFNLESLERKYGSEYDQEISDATAKTLEIIGLLKHIPEDKDASAGSAFEHHTPTATPAKATWSAPKEERSKFRFELFSVNKWLLLATIIVASVSGALFYWGNQQAAESSSAQSANDVNLSMSELKDYVRSARSTPSTLYAITQPSWDQLPEEKKKDLMRQAIVIADKTGQKGVQFVNVRGRVEAYASGDKIEIMHP